MKVIGFEAANSYVKVRTENGDTDVYFNVLWPVPDEFEASVMGGGTKYNIYEVQQEHGRFGKFKAGYRLADNYETSSGADSGRYLLPQYKNEAIIALTRNCQDGDELHVVTAVPADHYKIKSVHNDITKVLKGQHTVRVNDKTKMFNVVSVKVISQPVATAISAAYRIDGSVLTPNVLRNKKVIVDIGFGTTDIAVMAGLDIIETFSLSIAMSTAYELIRQRLISNNQEVLKKVTFNVFDLEAQLRDGDTFSIGGVDYDCKDIKKDAFNTVSKQILAALTNHGIRLQQYDMTIFGGGGIEALAEQFKPQLEGVNVAKVANPQGANALGCLIMGLHGKK
jgi:hypothetical protein